MTTFEQAFAASQTVRTMCNRVQLEFLFVLAAAAPMGAAVEVGVYHGGSLVCWSAAREGKGAVHAVDDWSSKARAPFLENVALFPWTAGVVVHEGRSPYNAAEVGPVSFCFIDGCHGLDGFGPDLAIWPWYIIPGGVIVFHDYDVWKPGVVVKELVDLWQAAARWEYVDTVWSTIAFRRPAHA